MFELKTLPKESIPSALQKAERYRLLNEPYEAQSICLDILQVDPENQQAVITLLLAYTDSFKSEIFPAYNKALEVLDRLGDASCKSYYHGIINERRARAHLHKGGPSSGQIAYDWYRKAMSDYEKALQTCSSRNENAALRWNTCARILNENSYIKPGDERSDVQLTDSYE